MELERSLVERVTRKVIEALDGNPAASLETMSSRPGYVVAGVSNRHVHLSPEHVEILFGKGYRLTVLRDLRQPGQYACKETLHVVTWGGVLENVRILGPERKSSQFELSLSDARKLRIDPPLAKSGSKAACPSVLLVGPKGSVVLDSGIGLAWRHVHLSPPEAQALGLKDGDETDVEVEGERSIVFRKVWIRVHESFLSEFHVDVDEANACGLKTGDLVRLCL
jgi:putative phosphotransacetylase